MKSNITFNNGKNNPITRDETLKVTALVYLQEALGNQAFEECAELAKTAKRFGADPAEIRAVIDAYVYGLKGGQNNETNPKEGGRLRFT